MELLSQLPVRKIKLYGFFFLLCLYGFTVNAQNTYTIYDDDNLVPNGSHLKDVNNDLNKFIGTWKTSVGNREYIFNLIKKGRFFSGLWQ